jgi:hypothetical protein
MVDGLFFFFRRRCTVSATLISGANEIGNDSFVGKTLDQVGREFGNLLNLPSENVRILVNDAETSDRNYVVRHGDRIEWVKAAGEKGIA